MNSHSTSVADPDPVLFDLWIRDRDHGSGMEKSGYEIQDLRIHLESYFRELSNIFLGKKKLKLIVNSVLRIRIREEKSRS
jgi:hypothetical protein